MNLESASLDDSVTIIENEDLTSIPPKDNTLQHIASGLLN